MYTCVLHGVEDCVLFRIHSTCSALLFTCLTSLCILAGATNLLPIFLLQFSNKWRTFKSTYVAFISSQLPQSMSRGGGTEMVLDAFPRLTSLTLVFDDASENITGMTLDFPSLESLHVDNAFSVENCNFSCPNLSHVSFLSCPGMVLPRAMITRLKHISTHVRHSYPLSYGILNPSLCLGSLHRFCLIIRLKCDSNHRYRAFTFLFDICSHGGASHYSAHHLKHMTSNST